MQIASSIFRRDDFLQPFLKWVFMYHHFYETFPRVSFIPGMWDCRRRIHKEEDFKHHFPRNLCVRHVRHEVKLNGAENLHHVKNGILGSVPCLASPAGSDSGTHPNAHNTAQQIKSNPFSHLDFRNGNKICFRRSERDTKKINESMSWHVQRWGTSSSRHRHRPGQVNEKPKNDPQVRRKNRNLPCRPLNTSSLHPGAERRQAEKRLRSVPRQQVAHNS